MLQSAPTSSFTRCVARRLSYIRAIARRSGSALAYFASGVGERDMVTTMPMGTRLLSTDVRAGHPPQPAAAVSGPRKDCGLRSVGLVSGYSGLSGRRSAAVPPSSPARARTAPHLEHAPKPPRRGTVDRSGRPTSDCSRPTSHAARRRIPMADRVLTHTDYAASAKRPWNGDDQAVASGR